MCVCVCVCVCVRVHVCVCTHVLSCVRLFAVPWTVALQVPLSFGIFLTQGLNPHLLHLLRWQVGFFTTEPPGKPVDSVCLSNASIEGVLACPEADIIRADAAPVSWIQVGMEPC